MEAFLHAVQLLLHTSNHLVHGIKAVTRMKRMLTLWLAALRQLKWLLHMVTLDYHYRTWPQWSGSIYAHKGAGQNI